MTTPQVVKTVEVQTSLGTIPVTGHFGDGLRVLAITGAFAELEEMSRFPVALAPEFDGLVARLPGHYVSTLTETSIETWAKAFDEVAAELSISVVMGISVGALVALAMRVPKALIAIEPPLSTAKLWPLTNMLRRVRGHGTFVENVFGVFPDRIEERGYRSLLDRLAIQTEVILGSDPLMPSRPTDRLPSLVDEPERQLLDAHPMVTLHVAPNAGHAVPYHAAALVHSVLLRTCRRVRDGMILPRVSGL